jgi:phage terminase small subunit
VTSAELTPRQNRFVQAYCGHLNASLACRESGYASTSGADAVTGHRLIRNAKVKAAIEALQQAKAREMELVAPPSSERFWERFRPHKRWENQRFA